MTKGSDHTYRETPIDIVTYAIGDIHGRLDLLESMLGLISSDVASKDAYARIVFTGDYSDRGPDSCGVVERLIMGPQRDGDTFICLKGNHDDLFVRCVTNGEDVPDWAWYLFENTLQSYGISKPDKAFSKRLARHASFLSQLPLTYDNGHYLFVHAGIRPGIPLESQKKEDLLWIRNEFLDYDGIFPRRVVHGHTIIGETPIVKENRISIDTGAFRSGVLTALVLDGGEIRFLQTAGNPDEGAITQQDIASDAAERGYFNQALVRMPASKRWPG